MVRTVEQQQIVDDWKNDITKFAQDPLLHKLTETDQQRIFARIAAQHPGIKNLLQIGEVKENTKEQ